MSDKPKKPAEYDYERIKDLLQQQETFPMTFTHKFIGKNTPAFKNSVADFEKQFPALTRQSSRNSGNDAHQALTYAFAAQNADEIIVLLKATRQIVDVVILL